MPLAIELAAARVRALSLDEIVGSLHDRFRLLTGGARTAVRRQQTLRASVDWSHALLTESERVLFRRLAVFMGGFDLDAAQAVAGTTEVERFQVLDQLSLLVDKSLVVAENATGRNAIPATGDGAPVRAGEARRVRRSRRGARAAPRSLHGDGGSAGRARTRRLRAAASSRRRSKSTTCARRSPGAMKTTTSQRLWSWRRRCSRCGWRGAASSRVWRGSTRRSQIATETSPNCRRRCARGHSPTRPCSNSWVDVTASLDQAQEALTHRTRHRRSRPADSSAHRMCLHHRPRCRIGTAVLRRGDRPWPAHWAIRGG